MTILNNNTFNLTHLRITFYFTSCFLCTISRFSFGLQITLKLRIIKSILTLSIHVLGVPFILIILSQIFFYLRMQFNDTYNVGFVAVLGCCNLQVVDKVINVVLCSTSVIYNNTFSFFSNVDKTFPQIDHEFNCFLASYVQ